MAKGKTTIRATVLYDGVKRIDDALVVIEGSKIAAVESAGKTKADFEGHVTPAFIDAHSHIGLFREGEPQDESEGNDISSQFMPLNDPLNSVYFDDRAFADAVDFGVLYSCLVPGSGNLLGGRAKVIRTWTPDRRRAQISDYGYKMALGFNPRSTGDWKGERPNTRMGTYQLLERKFDDVLAKKAKAEVALEKKLREIDKNLAGKTDKAAAKIAELDREAARKEADLELSSEEKEIVDLLSGKKTVKVHVHKEDDALYLVELKRRYGIRPTADHCGDVFRREIFDELAKAGIPVVYGPLGSLAYKVELRHSFYQNVEALVRSRAEYGLMTDHPVIMSHGLRDSLKFFMYAGLEEAEALSIITARNAAILGLPDLGTVAPGKLASIVVWDRDPLHLGSKPLLVMGEGEVLRRRK